MDNIGKDERKIQTVKIRFFTEGQELYSKIRLEMKTFEMSETCIAFLINRREHLYGIARNRTPKDIRYMNIFQRMMNDQGRGGLNLMRPEQASSLVPESKEKKKHIRNESTMFVNTAD